MQFTAQEIPGLYLIRPNTLKDNRGFFQKTFHADTFADVIGEQLHFRETYHSQNKAGVVRGMHLQRRPNAHWKLVYCPVGSVLDVVLDLRAPGFGRYLAFELTAAGGEMLLIPPGLAHGFQCLEDETLMMYMVTTEYAPANDTGVRFDSFGFLWPVDNPVISERDLALPALSDWKEKPF